MIDIVKLPNFSTNNAVNLKQENLDLFFTKIESRFETVQAIFNSLVNTKNEVLIALGYSNSSNLSKVYLIKEGEANRISMDGEIDPLFELFENGKCKKIVLAHNHPNNNTNPSFDDLLLTILMKKRMRAKDIALYDHLIWTAQSTYSFRAESTAFKRA